MTNSKPVKWGVLSTARIGVEKVIPGIQSSQLAHVAAIASRDPDKSAAVAGELGIDRSYGSYEQLLADPDIDVIYNPLPNHLHVRHTIAAVEAGKHVLCEKPIGVSAADAQALKAVRSDRLVMEAFMVRFHPQWTTAREWIRDGSIGRPVAIQSYFSYFNRDPENIRNRRETGGGALLDIGCYPIVAGRFLFEGDPERVMALVDRDPDFGTDRLTSALLDFGGGRHLDFTVSTQCVPFQRVNVFGTTGRIEILIPFNAPAGGRMQVRLDDGSELDGSAARCEVMPATDQYADQADAFSRAVLGEIDLPYDIDDALMNMRILDAVLRSEETGGWERP